MRCGLLGEKLRHSYSPKIHACFGDYGYDLFEVPPERLGDFLRAGEFQGLNVTIPYKETMLACCDELTDTAREIGSVNTVLRRRDGTLLGDNTDAAGFEGLVWKSRLRVLGRKCLVLGSGGGSLAVQYVLRRLGAGQVVVISRTGEDNYDNLDRHADAQLIVNATPLGMYPNPGAAAVDLRKFPRCEGVLDLIYNPARTNLLMQAEHLGIPCMDGLYMLTEQARCAAQIFTGTVIPAIRTEEIASRLRREMGNLILVGMPGCGKSTVGQLLAQKLERPFWDTDRELEKILGKPIGEYIIKNGEKDFREKETAVLEQLGKRSGLVIATGGGCVTRPENYPLLHQNGTIVFLERELSKLPKSGRPLSQRGSLSNLYTIRLPMYRFFADLTVDNDATLEIAAKRVEEAYEHFGD